MNTDRLQAMPDPSHEHSEEDVAGIRLLKKYPNRRLYDTKHSTYITLMDVKGLVMKGEVFVVRDAKTSADITRSVLLQIILEEESCGVPMLSTPVLAQIIQFYGHAMQGLMGKYLEMNMQAFADMQARLNEHTQSLSPDLWTQFGQAQMPLMQGWMGHYMAQSQTLFQQMSEHLNKQAQALFAGLGGIR